MAAFFIQSYTSKDIDSRKKEITGVHASTNKTKILDVPSK